MRLYVQPVFKTGTVLLCQRIFNTSSLGNIDYRNWNDPIIKMINLRRYIVKHCLNCLPTYIINNISISTVIRNSSFNGTGKLYVGYLVVIGTCKYTLTYAAYWCAIYINVWSKYKFNNIIYRWYTEYQKLLNVNIGKLHLIKKLVVLNFDSYYIFQNQVLDL